MIKFFSLAFIVLFSVSARAGGTIHLKGKIRSFDQNTLDIADTHFIYKIDRAQTSLSNPKSGNEVEFWVPFASIKDIKKVK